jgi:hypothetical protein
MIFLECLAMSIQMAPTKFRKFRIRFFGFLSAGFVVISSMSSGFSQDFLKKKIGSMEQTNSFRGVLFGTPLEDVDKSLSLLPVSEDQAKNDPLKLYIRNDERKFLGNIGVQEIVYYFLEGKFYAVCVATLDYRQTENLRKTLENIYGTVPQIDKESRGLVWSGKNTTAFMRFDKVTGEARTLICCNELQKNYNRLITESAKKAASEL